MKPEKCEHCWPLRYTGRTLTKTVSHVLGGYGLADGWVCLSLASQPEPTSKGDEAKHLLRLALTNIARWPSSTDAPAKVRAMRQTAVDALNADDALAASQQRALSEAPLSFSSATIETGMSWDEHEFEEVSHWMAIQPPKEQA